MENFRLGNTTITFSDDFEILNEFRQAVKAETDGISPGTDISKGIKEGRKPNVDRLAHGYTDYLNSIFTEELVPLAVNFLVHYDICNGVQREHNKKLNNGLPILHKVPPKRDYGRYFCIMAEKGGTSHGGLTEKLSPFFHAKKQEVNAYGR